MMDRPPLPANGSKTLLFAAFCGHTFYSGRCAKHLEWPLAGALNMSILEMDFSETPVHNSVYSQLCAILAECSQLLVGGGGVKGHKTVNKHFVNLSVPL